MLQHNDPNDQIFHQLLLALEAFPCSSPRFSCASSLKTSHDHPLTISDGRPSSRLLPSAKCAVGILTLKRSDKIAYSDAGVSHQRLS